MRGKLSEAASRQQADLLTPRGPLRADRRQFANQTLQEGNDPFPCGSTCGSTWFRLGFPHRNHAQATVAGGRLFIVRASMPLVVRSRDVEHPSPPTENLNVARSPARPSPIAGTAAIAVLISTGTCGGNGRASQAFGFREMPDAAGQVRCHAGAYGVER